MLDASILHIANSIANRVEPGRRLESCETKIDPSAWTMTGLTDEVFEPVIQSADENFLQTLNVLMPGGFLD